MKFLCSRFAAASAAVLVSTAAGASCGSAFCFVNTNWAVQGIWDQPGFAFDFHYEYIDQDQPMAGSRRIGVGEIPAHHDEVRTLNHNWFATVDYGFTPEWGATLVVPVVDREHEHIHNHHGEQIVQRWSFSDLGDMRLTGRWQQTVAATAERASFAGATFGLKLPTGKFDVTNEQGEVAERSLQPGTGTTDLILTAYFREALPQFDSSWFVQAGTQLPLNSRDQYKPGNQFGFDAGYRYDATDKLGLMLQANFRWKGRDSGAQAEPEDSGGRSITLSPGISYAFTPNVQVYGYVQLPLYQYVNGAQLTADWSAVAGISAQF